MVNGKSLGIAKKALVIGVKFGGSGRNTAGDIWEAWKLAINDAISKNRIGKAVFVLAYGKFCPTHR